MNTKDLQTLTFVGPTRENLVYSPLAVLSLDKRLSIFTIVLIAESCRVYSRCLFQVLIILCLFRSLTHGDVRFEESDSDVTADVSGVATSSNVASTKNGVDLKIAPVASFRSMFNVSSPTSRLGNSKKDSFSSADLVRQSFRL